MKLLFDHNLSPRLCEWLSDIFPDSTHVFRLDMGRVDDSAIWFFAAANDFTIVSKDSDFHQLAFQSYYGHHQATGFDPEHC